MMIIHSATKSFSVLTASFSLSVLSVSLLGANGTRFTPNNTTSNGVTYKVDPDGMRDPFNNLPDNGSTCGEFCTGANQFNFGLYACLKKHFKGTDDGEFPQVVLKEKLVDGNWESDPLSTFPKVIFSESTTFSHEYKSAAYNSQRVGGGYGSRNPAAIVFAEEDDDVQKAISCSRENGYKVAPRGRGHDCSGGWGIDGTVVIDMQLTCKLENFKDTYTRTGQEHIIAGSKILGEMKTPAGCTNAVRLAWAKEKFGDESLTLIGACPSVGVVGFLLNGGSGDATPYLGMGADVVQSIDMILYDGTKITVKKDDPDPEYRDIFWATAGGTGGLGIVTSFTEVVVENPGKNEYSYLFLTAKGMPNCDAGYFDIYQDFLYNDTTEMDSQSYLLGGDATLCSSSGIFLGSEDKVKEVLGKAGLTDSSIANSLHNEWLPLIPPIMQPYPSLCPDGNCPPNFCTEHPEECRPYSILPFSSQADIQLRKICWFTNNEVPLFDPMISRGFDVCADLGLDTNEYCCNWKGLTTGDPSWNDPYVLNPDPEKRGCTPIVPNPDYDNRYVTRVDISRCHEREVLDAYAKAAKNPKSFLNLAFVSQELVDFADFKIKSNSSLEPFSFSSQISTFGQLPILGQGTGGLMLPKLQKSTIEKLLEFSLKKDSEATLYDAFGVNHLQHGAPMLLDDMTNGYAHRNTALMTPAVTRSPELVNVLLSDPAYNNDPRNLQIYMNYNPSQFLPYRESVVYGYEHSAKLSEIRTKVDVHGIFDSPRYIQRNLRTERTVPRYPPDYSMSPTKSPTKSIMTPTKSPTKSIMTPTKRPTKSMKNSKKLGIF